MAKQQYPTSKTPAPVGAEESVEQTEQQQTTAEQTGETQQPPASEAPTQEQTEGTDPVVTPDTNDGEPDRIQTESLEGTIADANNPVVTPQTNDGEPDRIAAATVQEPVQSGIAASTAGTETPVVTETALTESATERFANEPAQVSTLRQELQNYIGVMAPNRRIDPQEGAGHQTALARLIESTITEPDSRVFIAKMSVWLETIRDHRSGVFSERYVNRFADSIALSKSKLQSFQYLVHLFLTTADGTPVNASIEMDTALRGVNPDYAARLRQYVERVTKR